MINATKAIYSSIVALILGGSSLGYYLLSGNSTSLDAQSIEELNSENSSTVVNNDIHSAQHQVTETESTKKQYDEREIDIQFKDGNDWIRRPVTDKYPSWKNDPYLIEQAEKYKKLDPVLYRHNYDNPFHKTVNPEEAKKKLDVLMDYTMMVAYSAGCPGGTAWIFDYVLPEGNQKYPTKFFIASNGHVVNAFKFDSTNPYSQTLPDNKQDVKDIWRNSDCFRRSKNGGEITLIKEKVKHEDGDFERKNWKSAQHKYKGKEMWHSDYKYDLSKHQSKQSRNLDPDYWRFTFSNPKLFYVPHNYVKSKAATQEHIADFAIFEVDFKDEEVAKLFTRDFYGKYDREKGTHKEKALNFFAEPLHKKYTNQQLLEEDIQVWMAGYPTIGMHHKASTNYNINRKSASRLAYRNVKGADDRMVLGAMDHRWSSASWTWAGKGAREIGYVYAFDNPEITHGASGSLAATGNGDILGVYSWVSAYSDMGGVTPFRNIEIRDKNGQIVFDKYDFIEGAEGQQGSYKEQVQKYILKDGKQTSLSKLRNWK